MKTKWLLLLAVVACGFARGEALPHSARVAPEVFASREAAERYVKKLIAGGAIEMLRPGKQEILVLQVYGSGVPDIAIAAYRLDDGKWRRVAEIGCAVGGCHRAVVRDGAIIVVSDRSAEESVLLSADETEG